MSGSSTSSLIVTGALLAGKYRLDSLIGEGGMGSVWSATHVGLGQAVAIKFISRDFLRSEEALRRFDAEAKAAAQLRSRHVVQVFDTGRLEDGTPYIAMELLRGETLQGRVHRAGPVQLPEAVDILSQCCKALGRAHAAGIIHRDIKPDNIFLAQSNDDDSALVKILDFGVAKMGATGNEQGSQGATRTGAVLGTPLYMSPEQARGLKNIDQRTDLYSLGLVAYTMFTGNLAFSSESFGDLLLQICTAPLPSLAAGAPWLPPAIDAWFQRACAREPAHRYATAQEFADALRNAAGVTLQSPRGSHLPDVPGSGVGPVGQGSEPGNLGRPAFASTGGGTSPGISRSGGDAYATPGGASKKAMSIAGGVAAVVAAAVVGLVVVGKSKPNDKPPTAAAPPPVQTAGTAPRETLAATGVSLAALPSPALAASGAPSANPVPTLSAEPAAQAGREHEKDREKVTGTLSPHTGGKTGSGTATPSAGGHHAAPAGTVDLGY
jgi:eukaryotic-like serine/threonine-protein kinase